MVILSNGRFELSHYRLWDPVDRDYGDYQDVYFEVFLQNENAVPLEDYWAHEDMVQTGINHFVSGNRVRLDDDFGFDSDNYADQVSVTYDSGNDQTFIDINTATFTKDDVVVIDGRFELDTMDLQTDGFLILP